MHIKQKNRHLALSGWDVCTCVDRDRNTVGERMTASRREAGQENFRDKVRQQPRGVQRHVGFSPFSWPAHQCAFACVCCSPTPAHTPCSSYCLVAVQTTVEPPCGAGLVPGQHGGKRGGRRAGTCGHGAERSRPVHTPKAESLGSFPSPGKGEWPCPFLFSSYLVASSSFLRLIFCV